MAQLFSAFLLLFAAAIDSSCSLMMCRGGCLLARTSFGGRIMFTGSDRLGNGGRPSWIAPKSKIIFQTPRGLDFASRSLHNSLYGFGRGKVWIGKRRKCARSDVPSDICPLNENHPCLDTTLPCRPDICKADLSMKTLSKLIGHARIVADWSNLPDSCDVAHQSITIQQMTWDGNCNVTDEMSEPKTFHMQNGDRRKTFESLPAYSTFKITLRVTSLSGEYVTSKMKTTTETDLERRDSRAAPRNVTMKIRRVAVVFSWIEPPCGTRHGEIIKYGYKMWSDDTDPVPNYVTTSHVTFRRQRMPENRYYFQVCACTRNGDGPYSNKLTVDVTY